MADIGEQKPNRLIVDELTARIEEDMASLYSAFMAKLLKAESGKQSTVIEEYIGDRFDVRACWYLSAVRKESHVEPYLAALDRFGRMDVEALIAHFASSLPHRELVDARIVGRISYWKSEAMRRVREKAAQQRVASVACEDLAASDTDAPVPGVAEETTMSVFGNRPVTVVRDAGTPKETRRDVRMGGDFVNKLLFNEQDAVRTGDEIHCELFDEPRIVVRVDPVLASRGVAHWEATIMPRSEWSRGRQANPNPPSEVATSPHGVTTAKKRGRHSNPERRDAIQKAILSRGEAWRDHLAEIFNELDREEVDLGDFQTREIDLGDGQNKRASSWEDLDLADGDQRKKLIDALRKYRDERI